MRPPLAFRRFLSRLSRRRSQPSSKNQRGYAYLMALFMVTTLIIASQVAVRNYLTEGRREREDQLIWRGQQYVRAIRLYYRKTGHYPSNLDDLKKGMPELHFLRYAAYKDPMKKDDGAWRFIYVNAAGQIIGSTKYATLQQMAILDMNGGKIPGVKTQGDDSGQPGVPASSLADQSNNLNSSNPPGSDNNANSSNASNSSSQIPSPNSSAPPGSVGGSPDNSQNAGIGSGAPNSSPNPNSPQPGPNAPGASPSPTNAAGTPAGGPGGINTNMNNQSMAALAALKPTGPVDGPVLGGFLTGVASSVDKPSIRIYNGGKKYLNWEFIWNPVEDQAKAVQQGITNPAGTAAGQPGQSIGSGPAGTSIFGNGAGATSSPMGGSSPASPSPSPSPNSTSPNPSPQ